jgi:hypothetical protein
VAPPIIIIIIIIITASGMKEREGKQGDKTSV